MSSWSVILGDGIGDIAASVELPSIKRTKRLFTEMRPNSNTCQFRVAFSAALIQALTAATAPISCTITKDGSPYFAGYLSPNHETPIRNGRKTISITVEDPTLQKLSQTIAAITTWAGFSVCNPASQSTSLVHAIAAAAGVTLAAGAPTISAIVPYVCILPEDKATWAGVLADLLFEYGYCYQFIDDGTLQVFKAINTGAITTSGLLRSGSAGNLADELVIKKTIEKYDDIRISFRTVQAKTGIVLFQDSSGASGNLACNISLAANGDAAGDDYYPKGSKDGEVFSNWNSPNGDKIWIATSAELDATLAGGISLSRALTNYFRKASFAYHNGNATPAAITKLRITGNAYVETSQGIARSANSGKQLLEYGAKYLFDKDAAQALASGIFQYYAFSDLTYLAKSKDSFAVGDYVQVEDSHYSGISVRCRIVARIDDESTLVRQYELEAVEDFVGTSIVVEGGNSSPTPTPITVVNDTTAPSVPSGLSVSQLSTGALRIGFNASTDAESGVALYRVYRRENGSLAEGVVVDVNGGGAGPYLVDDTSPIPGKSYQYAVAAVDARGNESAKSSWSAAVLSIVSDPPTSVPSLSAAATAQGVSLSWAANQDAIAYRLEKSTDGGATWPTILTVNTNSYFEALPAGTEPGALANWRYRVKGISKDGVLSASYSSTATPSVGSWTWIPAVPTVTAAIGKRTATISVPTQASLVDPRGWFFQISRDGVNWYRPNLLAASDADSWYSGSLGNYLVSADPQLVIGYLPIPLSNGLPLASGQVYYFRVAASALNNGASAWSPAAGPFTAYPGLYADLAAEQIQTALLANGAAKASKIAADLQGLSLNSDPMFSDISAWFADFTGTRLTSSDAHRSIVTVTDGIAGPRALQVDDQTANSYYVVGEKNSIDPSKTYRLSLAVKQVSGTGGHYLGVVFYDANGVSIAGSTSGMLGWAGLGTYFYCLYINAAFPASFTRREFFMGPVGSGLGEIPPAARSVQLLWLPFYGAGTGVAQIQDYRLEECISTSLLMAGSVITSKLAANAVTAGKLGVTNLDVDGVANVISMNASLVYSAATAQVGSATGTKLLAAGPAAGKYAYNFFDLDGGKFRVGDADNYIYYDGAGALTLRITSFRVSTLQTRLKGTLEISDLGDVDAGLTKPLQVHSDGLGSAYFGVNGVTALKLSSAGGMYGNWGEFAINGDGIQTPLLLQAKSTTWTAGYGSRLALGGGTDARFIGAIEAKLAYNNDGGYSNLSLRTRYAEAEYVPLVLNANGAAIFAYANNGRAGLNPRLAQFGNNGDTGTGNHFLEVFNNSYNAAYTLDQARKGFSISDNSVTWTISTQRNAGEWGSKLRIGSLVTADDYSSGFNDKLVVDSLGNLSIGIDDSAGYKLRVLGNALFGNSNRPIRFSTSGSPDYGSHIFLSYDVGTQQSAFQIAAVYPDYFKIRVATGYQAYGGDPSALAYVDAVTITRATADVSFAGRVSIGTTDPAGHKLRVNGAIKADLGFAVTNYWNDNTMQAEAGVFNAFSPIVPNIGDRRIVSGSYMRRSDNNFIIFSYVERVSATTLGINGFNITTRGYVYDIITAGSGTAYLNGIGAAW